MSFPKLNNLQNDILLLYSSIKDKRLENLFIKVADKSLFAVEKWLHQVDYDKLNLSDGNVWVGFQALFKLKKQHPSGFTRQNLMDFLFPSGKTDPKTLDSANIIPYLISFSKVQNQADLVPLLGPFSDILTIIGGTNIEHDFSISEGIISSDLSKMAKSLESFYNKSIQPKFDNLGDKLTSQKLTKKESLDLLFKRLLKDFTRELVQNISGHEKWHEKLKSELPNGIISNPIEVLKTMHPADLFLNSEIKSIKDLSKYTLKNYSSNYEELLENIKYNALLMAKIKNKQEVINHLLKRQTGQVKNMLENKPKHETEFDSIMESNHWNNKKVILFFSMFLFTFFNDIKG